MRITVFVLILVGLAVVQVTLADFLSLWGNKPDLLLAGAVGACLMSDLRFEAAVVIAAFCGILKDVTISGTFGRNFPLLILWSVLIWQGVKKISIETMPLKAALVLLTALVHNIVTGCILAASGVTVPAGIFFRNVVFGSIYTALFSPLVFELVRRLSPRRRSGRRMQREVW